MNPAEVIELRGWTCQSSLSEAHIAQGGRGGGGGGGGGMEAHLELGRQ